LSAHPYESKLSTGATNREAVSEGLVPLRGPFPWVTESNANPGAWLRNSFCLSAHPYESKLSTGATNREAVSEGLVPLCGPFPLVTESNANPGAWLRHSFCAPSHPYESKLSTGVPSHKNAALSCGALDLHCIAR